MDTPQTTLPEASRKAAISPARFLLFGGIVLVAIVSVMLAILLPNQKGDIRELAWTSAACAGKVTVAASACNGKCAVDADCSSGMICYKTTAAATEGVCRSSGNPTSTTCGVATASPSSSPLSSPSPSSSPLCPNITKPITRSYTTSDSKDVYTLVSGGPVTYTIDATFPTNNNAPVTGGSVNGVAGIDGKTGTLNNGQSLTFVYPDLSTWGPGDQFGTREIHVDINITGACGSSGYGWDRFFQSQMLSNSAFDSGSFSPWTMDQTNGTITLDTANKHDGAASAKFVTTTVGTAARVQLRQNVSLTAGKTYTVSLWAKASSSRSSRVTVQQAVSPYGSLGTQTFTLGTAWQSYQFSFTPTVTQNAQLTFNAGDVLGTMWVDSVSMTSN